MIHMSILKYLTGQFFFLMANFGDIHAFAHRERSGVKGLTIDVAQEGSNAILVRTFLVIQIRKRGTCADQKFRGPHQLFVNFSSKLFF